MFSKKTAIVAIFPTLFFIAPVYAQDAPGRVNQVTTGGLRIQLDAQGNRMQKSASPKKKKSKKAKSSGLPDSSTRVGDRQAVQSGSSSATSAPAPQVGKPQVVHNHPETGAVVRLNGMFRAGSHAHVGPDGKIQSNCHIETGAAPVKDHHK